MQYTDAEVREAAGRARPVPVLSGGGSGTEAEYSSILAEVSSALISDPDAPLWLLRLLKDRLVTKAESVRKQLVEIEASVTGVDVVDRTPVVDTEAFDALDGHLKVLRVETGAQAVRRSGLVGKSVDAVVKGLGVAAGGDVRLGRKEAYERIRPVLEALPAAWAEVVDLQGRFVRVLDEYVTIGKPSLVARADRGVGLVSELRGDLRRPEHQARRSTAALLALKGSVTAGTVVKSKPNSAARVV